MLRRHQARPAAGQVAGKLPPPRQPGGAAPRSVACSLACLLACLAALQGGGARTGQQPRCCLVGETLQRCPLSAATAGPASPLVPALAEPAQRAGRLHLHGAAWLHAEGGHHLRAQSNTASCWAELAESPGCPTHARSPGRPPGSNSTVRGRAKCQARRARRQSPAARKHNSRPHSTPHQKPSL